jgi:hypothetical protein
MLNVILLIIIMLNVIMVSVIMLSIIMLSVIMLSVIMLSVVAPIISTVAAVFTRDNGLNVASVNGPLVGSTTKRLSNKTLILCH